MTEESYRIQDVFAELISPFAGAERLGEKLRSPEDATFKELKAMIDLDSAYFRSGQGQPASWPSIIEKTRALLSRKSKDLEVLVWLVRGLVKAQGLVGLADGFMLLRTYHHEYWESHRSIKQDDIGGINWCLGRIDWLNEKLEADISELPLFDPRLLSDDKGIDALKAQELAQTATPLSYYHERESLLKRAQDEYRWLSLVLEKKYVGEGLAHPVSLSKAQARLQGRALELEGLIAKKSLPAAKASNKAAGDVSASVPAEALAAAPVSRDMALAMLSAAADYLAQTEPLSPVPHLVRRAMRWARGSLQDWLAEIIGHRSAELEAIYQTLDMKQAESAK